MYYVYMFLSLWLTCRAARIESVHSNSTMSQGHLTCCGASGKVLLTGGYLVLKRPNKGLVVTVDAKIYTLVESKPGSGDSLLVTIKSPQFLKSWTYEWKNGSLNPSLDQDENLFVETTLRHTFNTLATAKNGSFGQFSGQLEITIVGDNGFYSQRKELEQRGLPFSSEGLRQLPLFRGTKQMTSRKGEDLR